VVNGKWHIDARLGSGGMATVYAATHRNGHRAALKVLHPQLSSDPDTRARFLREAYVANSIDHPRVVKVQDDGIAEDGSVFLVLDLLEGETIESRREKLGGKLPIGEALSIAEQALDALGAAHEKGIVHRDVKPDNVFLTKEGNAMLLDFGLARMKSLRAEETKTGVTIGTPEFMPPEQAAGRREEVDARSDVWGLGAMLFTMITGRPVHEAASLHEQLVASAFKRARPVRDLVPELPPAVAVVIDRALELEKADRWESAREMHRALRNARAPRDEAQQAPGFVSDSLTMPAASPASIRRSEAAVPESGPRPSNPLNMPVPTSDRTLKEQVLVLDAVPVPSSDKTISEALPRTPKMIDERAVGGIRIVPSVPPPISSSPSTERITGPVQRPPPNAELSPPSSPTLASTPDLIVAPPRVSVPIITSASTQRAQLGATKPSAQGQGPIGPGPQPNLGTTGPNPPVNLGATGPNPPVNLSASGANPIASPGIVSAPPSFVGSNVTSIVTAPPAQAQQASQQQQQQPHPPAGMPIPTSPPQPTIATTGGSGPHPVGAVAEPGPVSIRARRSARTAVVVCVLLIVACAGVAAWVMYGRQ